MCSIALLFQTEFVKARNDRSTRKRLLSFYMMADSAGYQNGKSNSQSLYQVWGNMICVDSNPHRHFCNPTSSSSIISNVSHSHPQKFIFTSASPWTFKAFLLPFYGHSCPSTPELSINANPHICLFLFDFKLSLGFYLDPCQSTSKTPENGWSEAVVLTPGTQEKGEAKDKNKQAVERARLQSGKFQKTAKRWGHFYEPQLNRTHWIGFRITLEQHKNSNLKPSVADYTKMVNIIPTAINII